MPPKVDVFTTSIQSSGALRGRHERVARHLASARVAYTSHDVASDPEAKRFWQRKNGANPELPCVLVDGERVGSVEEMDEAVEFGELRHFLRLDQPAAASSPPPAATLDDFASLSLSFSPEELDSLTSGVGAGSGSFSLDDLLASESSFDSSLGTAGGTSQSFEFAETKPLSFGRNKSDTVTVKRAMGVDHALANDVDDWAGIELTQEEAEALARELGLDGDDLPTVASATSPVLEAAESVPPMPPSPVPPPLAPRPAQAASVPTLAPSPLVALQSTNSLDGPGGASLSAPLAEVSALHLSSPRPSSPPPTKLSIEPISDYETRVRAEAAAHAKAAEPKEDRHVQAATVAEVERLRKTLNRDEGDTGRGSKQVPVVGVQAMEMKDKVAKAVMEGFL